MVGLPKISTLSVHVKSHIKNIHVFLIFGTTIVPDPGKGVFADPVNGGAILRKGGPDPHGGNRERQLSPDKGKDKT